MLSLPCRQTRGAAGGRRDRLQELHQENPVGTWGVSPPKGLGSCHVPSTSSQMSLACCGTPSLWRGQVTGQRGDATGGEGLSFASPCTSAHPCRDACACFHPKICPFPAHAWLVWATRCVPKGGKRGGGLFLGALSVSSRPGAVVGAGRGAGSRRGARSRAHGANTPPGVQQGTMG